MRPAHIRTTYSNRQDAEVAKARLAKSGIDALIVADDVCPPFQLTEGARLRVLKGVADRAHRVLAEDTSVSVEGEVTEEMHSKSTPEKQSASLTFGSGGLVQAAAWKYVAAWTCVAAFLFMVAIILTSLLAGL